MSKIEEYQNKIKELKAELKAAGGLTKAEVDRMVEAGNAIKFYEKRIKELKEAAEVYGLDEV